MQSSLRFLLAGMLVLVLLLKGNAIADSLLQGHYVDGFSAISAGVFLLLLVASIIGLIYGVRLGFYATYLLVGFSTMVLGISLVPFAVSWLPLEMRIVAIVGLNVIVALVCGITHWLHLTKTSRA
jgi:hypothetical protein